MNSIPIVDCDGDLDASKSAILSAIWDVGFVYLKNCGIAGSTCGDLLNVSRKFFALPASEKKPFSRTGDDNWGYVNPGMETLSQNTADSQVELRESFNVTFPFGNKIWPTSIPKFQESVEKLFVEGQTLAIKLLCMIAEKLDDNEVILKGHSGIGSANNSSAIRMLHYPPVPPTFAENVARCGEHSDYGSITLLFQDSVGGLEVQNKHGEFVYAAPVEGAVLVNTGDLLERWSDGAVKAVRHRVRTPAQLDPLRAKERYSIAFFIQPDDDAVVVPLNGSDRYPPTTGKQYLVEQFSKTYV